MRRRPSRSARRPPSSRNPPKVRVYAFTTQERSFWANSRSRPIDASSTTTNWAVASSARARFLARLVSAGVTLSPQKRNSGSGLWQYTEWCFRLSRTRVKIPLMATTMRADAARNHERILAAAREAFTESGSEAQVEEIARRAGVGVGTFYRHFESKDVLVGELIRIK